MDTRSVTELAIKESVNAEALNFIIPFFLPFILFIKQHQIMPPPILSALQYKKFNEKIMIACHLALSHDFYQSLIDAITKGLSHSARQTDCRFSVQIKTSTRLLLIIRLLNESAFFPTERVCEKYFLDRIKGHCGESFKDN